MNDGKIKVAYLAILSGLSDSTLRLMSKRGELPPIENGEIDASESIRALFGYYRDQVSDGPTFLTFMECSQATGIPIGKIRAAKQAGAPGIKNNRVKLFPLLRWMFQQQARDSNEPDINYERARLYREQADKLALKNQLMRRELVRVADVVEQITRALRPLRDRVINLESYATKCNQADPEAARAVLRQWGDETLAMMRSAVGGLTESAGADATNTTDDNREENEGRTN